MKLLNQSLKYLSVSLLLIISLWAVIFYINMLDEIYDSIDDGLDNYKLLIIQKAAEDHSVLTKSSFGESNYAIQEISESAALSIKDRYIDTLMFMPDENDLEPVRMLSTAFQNNGHFYRLNIISSMVEEDDLIEDLFWSVFWLYLVLVVSIIVINNLVLRKLWRPFYNFLAQLKNFRLGSSNDKPEIRTAIKEFNDLQNAVNALVQHSLETYQNQKQFIENASHELQTPLAISTGKLELLLEKKSLQNDDAAKLSEVLQVLERMARLNKSLLLLAKIDNRQFFDNSEQSVNKLVHQYVNDLGELAEYRQISISITEASTIFIHAEPSLIGILISNLIRNAIFHNIPGGFVTIDISEKVMKVCNSGAAEPLDARNIFNRFYKPASGTPGTGLGLAIVKAVCNMYGFKVSYHFTESRHCFEIDFTRN